MSEKDAGLQNHCLVLVSGHAPLTHRQRSAGSLLYDLLWKSGAGKQVYPLLSANLFPLRGEHE